MLPLPQRLRWLGTLSDREAEVLLYDWSFWARTDQQLPEGDWQTWLVLAGRGFGKTRVGAEVVRHWVRSFRLVNLIAATADDARDILVEGESGILAICPRGERPHYVVSKRRLEWPNGARSLIFSADEPERLRGKQHEKLWCDELASWRYAEAWDQAMFGLRLGANPQAVVTTTPKAIPIIKELLADPSTHITRGSTYANRANLAPKFFAKIIRKYEGTRLGRQELDAEVLTDNPRALWQRSQIDKTRLAVAPQLARIVVGLDPNAKNRNEDADAMRDDLDAAGVLVCGVGAQVDAQGRSHFYVLDDRSVDEGPNVWGKTALRAYRDHKADRIIGEVNNGGDMVEMVIRAVSLEDGTHGRNASYKSVTATRGKALRAEPISALYEQGRVHHVGAFAELEDEMCDFDPLIPPARSPNRMDALVWALTELSDDGEMGMLDFMRAQAAGATPPTFVPGSKTIEGWPASVLTSKGQ